MIVFSPFTGKRYAAYIGLVLLIANYDYPAMVVILYSKMLTDITPIYLSTLQSAFLNMPFLNFILVAVIGTLAYFFFPMAALVPTIGVVIPPGILIAWWLKKKVVKRIGKSVMNLGS